MVLCHRPPSARPHEGTPPCQDISPCECAHIIGHDHMKAKRARKFRCKSKRIRALALPKCVNRIPCNEPTCPKTSVEVIKTFEEQTPVRIKLLSYPKVRKLVSSRDAYKKIVDKEWIERFETLIRSSMLTMYSRLANVQLSETKPGGKKWKKKDWQRHCEWLKTRAMPKLQRYIPAPKRKSVPISSLGPSILALSRPRHPREKYRTICGYRSPVKEAALAYEPSERIYKLSAPKNVTVPLDNSPELFHVNPNALKFKPTSRLQKLAVPKPGPKPEDFSQYTAFGVIKTALKARLKERTLELAKPKEKEDDEEEKPFVNPKALKARPTPRILELAKPRGVVPPIKA